MNAARAAFEANKALEERVARIEQRLDQAKIESKVVVHWFNNNPSWSIIPGSTGARFCGLSHVDDDNGPASCGVRSSGGNWEMMTGSNASGNACEVTCLFVDLNILSTAN